MRCFVAVDLPDHVRAALDAAQARLRAADSRAGIRWTAGANLHLTLEFLGEVSPDVIAGVRAALAGVAARIPPIVLDCGGLGVFPGPARPRVLWAGISGGLDRLGALAGAVERALEPLGFPAALRPFRGHVTLGRVRSSRGWDAVGRVLDEARDTAFGSWTVAEVVLYRSHLAPGGSRYEVLARLPLGASVA